MSKSNRWIATLGRRAIVNGAPGILSGATVTTHYVTLAGPIAADGDALSRARRFATASAARSVAVVAAASVPGSIPGVTRY
jgi:hypothetical protein